MYRNGCQSEIDKSHVARSCLRQNDKDVRVDTVAIWSRSRIPEQCHGRALCKQYYYDRNVCTDHKCAHSPENMGSPFRRRLQSQKQASNRNLASCKTQYTNRLRNPVETCCINKLEWCKARCMFASSKICVYGPDHTHTDRTTLSISRISVPDLNR